MYVDLVLLDLATLIMVKECRGLPHVHLAGGGLHVVKLDEVALRVRNVCRQDHGLVELIIALRTSWPTSIIWLSPWCFGVVSCAIDGR
jgi:hypothetical protein